MSRAVRVDKGRSAGTAPRRRATRRTNPTTAVRNGKLIQVKLIANRSRTAAARTDG
jgi:hypothetical protein